jgi:hypothetical protein
MGRTELFRAAAAAAIVTAGTLALAFPGTAASAAPRPEVGPHQAFEGLVDGKQGTPDPVRIFVECHGPKQQTGHPTPGQTVEVLPASSVAGNSGNTGDAGTSITAFFGAPPPAAHAALLNIAARRTTVSFDRYAVSKPMPQGLELPCSGTGQVTFIAFPRTPPTSRAAVVPVEYMPQP